MILLRNCVQLVKSAREAFSGFSRQRLERIVSWQTEINLSVLPLSAGEETIPQIRRLLGQSGSGRRGTLRQGGRP